MTSRLNASLVFVAVVLLIGRAVDQSFADADAQASGEPQAAGLVAPVTRLAGRITDEPASPVVRSGRVPARAGESAALPDSSARVSVWIRVADCESGDGDGQPPYTASWHYDGYHDGGLQFLPSTWNMAKRLRSVRSFAAGYGYAYHAPAWVQIRVADAWLAVTSWRQWPECSRRLGLR